MTEDENELYICVQCPKAPCMFVIQPNKGIPISCPIHFDIISKWENANEVKTWQKTKQKLSNSKPRKRS